MPCCTEFAVYVISLPETGLGKTVLMQTNSSDNYLSYSFGWFQVSPFMGSVFSSQVFFQLCVVTIYLVISHFQAHFCPEFVFNHRYVRVQQRKLLSNRTEGILQL